MYRITPKNIMTQNMKFKMHVVIKKRKGLKNYNNIIFYIILFYQKLYKKKKILTKTFYDFKIMRVFDKRIAQAQYIAN